MRGNLNYLLRALSRNPRESELVEQIQPAFQLYEQTFLSEKSLWYRKRPRKRTKAEPVVIEEAKLNDIGRLVGSFLERLIRQSPGTDR